MSSLTIPETLKVVGTAGPAADAAGRTSRYVSLKNLSKVWVRAHITQGNAATIALTLLQATSVAGAGSKALANAVPIWANQDVAAGDAFVRQSDGVAFTTSAAVKEKEVIFQIDPAKLDLANGYKCIALSTGASNVANITSISVIGETAFPGDASPSIAID